MEVGLWQGRAITFSAEWTLARSLAGCAEQEHPILAGKMLMLRRAFGSPELCQLEPSPARGRHLGCRVRQSWGGREKRDAKRESWRGL